MPVDDLWYPHSILEVHMHLIGGIDQAKSIEMIENITRHQGRHLGRTAGRVVLAVTGN